MIHTPPHVVRLLGLIVLIVSLPVSVGHARARADLAYRVRVLALDAPVITGFNDRRQVIGYAPQGGTTIGFVWDAEHGFQFIRPSGFYADNRAWAMPSDINKHGEVVGFRSVGPGSTSAFLRQRSGTILDLGAFAAGALNDRGQVAGAVALPTLESRAVLWTAETGWVELGGSDSRAQDINNKRVIVGQVQNEAVIWTDIGTWQGLGFLGDSPFGPPRYSAAYAINDRGWVAGTSTAATGGAFLWTPETGMENLGALDLGGDIHLSSAIDISQHGTVVGVSLGWLAFAGEYETLLPRAFVWTRRTGILALDDLVPAGWIISHVIAINDRDEILATASYLNSDSRTVVLEPVKGPLR